MSYDKPQPLSRRERFLGCVGIGLLLLGMGIAGAKAAEGGYTSWGEGEYLDPEVWYENVKPGQAHYGRLVYWNRLTIGAPDTHTVDTLHGPVTVHLLRTYNENCDPAKGCPDVLEVYDLPDGVVASEWAVEVDEGYMAIIKLYLYRGS